jgi:hypothetical protein
MINTTQFLTTNGIIKPLSTTQSRHETLHRENQYTPRSQYEIPSQNPTWSSTASFMSIEYYPSQCQNQPHHQHIDLGFTPSHNPFSSDSSRFSHSACGPSSYGSSTKPDRWRLRRGERIRDGYDGEGWGGLSGD